MRRKKQSKYIWLLLLLLVVTIGYAAVATTLNITGSAVVKKNTWNVYWQNPVVVEGSVSSEAPVIGEDDNDPENTKVSFEADFDMPGDFYEFTIEAVNDGTIDAMVLDMALSNSSELPDYIKCTIVYDDNNQPLGQFHRLPKASGGVPTVVKYRVRIEYTEDVTPADMNAVPTGGASYQFTYGVQYTKADSRAIDRS